MRRSIRAVKMSVAPLSARWPWMFSEKLIPVHVHVSSRGQSYRILCGLPLLPHKSPHILSNSSGWVWLLDLKFLYLTTTRARLSWRFIGHFLTHILFLESPPDPLGRSGRRNRPRRDGLSTVKCQRTRGVAFQNKLAFLSRTGSPVCLGRGRWKKRSWHLGWRTYLFLHLHPCNIEAVSEFCFRGTTVSNTLRGSLPTVYLNSVAEFQNIAGASAC